MGNLWRDLRYAVRVLGKSPGFTAVAVLSAALGIGTCSTIFGIANYALFRRLPAEQPSQLMAISGTSPSSPGGGDFLSIPNFQDLQKAHSFEGVTAFFPMLAASINASNEPQRTWGAIVTSNYFGVVRPKFSLGHGFTSQDDTPGEPPVVVLSYHLWQTKFGSDPNIVGKSVEINKARAVVTGVTAPGFRGTELAIISDFWVPFSMASDFPSLPAQRSTFYDRKAQWVIAIGRLRDGVKAGQCRAELDLIAKRIAEQYPESNKGRGFRIETAGQISPALGPVIAVLFSLLLGVTILVLLTACANIANLLLAKASARQKEIATRLAVGAGRGRLIRQLLTESIVLGLLGGAAGLVLAFWGATILGKFKLPISLPVDFSVSLDIHVVLFCSGLSIFTGIIFGLVPALRATKPDLVRALKDESIKIGSNHRYGLRNLLVIAQVAFSTLLLVCSGLFLHSLYSSRTMDIGMGSRNVLLLSFDPTQIGHTDLQSRQFLKSLLDRAQALPGVESASVTDSVPLSFGGTHDSLVPEDKMTDPDRNRIFVDVYRVAPNFFTTLGIPLLQGQDFGQQITESDGMVIVNEALAKRAFTNQNPLDHRISYGGKLLRIGGVVATAKSRTIGEEAKPCLYLPILDVYQGNAGSNLLGLTLLLRTKGDPAPLASSARSLIHGIEPALTVFDVRTLQTHLDNALLFPRLAALTFGLCGLMGLLISTIGIYGVVSFGVARRTKEIGIRMALGAQRSQVVSMVLREGLVLTAVGCCIGIGAALAVGQLARTALYGISPRDPLAFVLAPLILTAIEFAACLIPARRAAALDPVRAVRYE